VLGALTNTFGRQRRVSRVAAPKTFWSVACAARLPIHEGIRHVPVGFSRRNLGVSADSTEAFPLSPIGLQLAFILSNEGMFLHHIVLQFPSAIWSHNGGDRGAHPTQPMPIPENATWRIEGVDEAQFRPQGSAGAPPNDLRHLTDLESFCNCSGMWGRDLSRLSIGDGPFVPCFRPDLQLEGRRYRTWWLWIHP
jgi:hypothetical protein